MILYSTDSSGDSPLMGIYICPGKAIFITRLPKLFLTLTFICVSSEKPFIIISLNIASKASVLSEIICLLTSFFESSPSIKLPAFEKSEGEAWIFISFNGSPPV